MYHGSCLCENILWEVDPVPVPVYHCHCSMCRKMHGAAFGTYAYTPSENFRWSGELDTIRNYQSSPMLVRSFCSTCGSVVPNQDGDKPYYFIPIGSQDDGPKVDSHIFTASKASWMTINDKLPKYDEFPPDMDSPTVSSSVEKFIESTELQGSCLCKRIRFKIIQPFMKIYNCHCQRCRRARSAAFTTNGFTVDKEVVFIEGEEHLKSYKLPSAKTFTQVFCDYCGSSMPRVSPDRKIAVIPLGALDHDLDQQPDCNIWFDSSANWYTPVNDLITYPKEPPE
ncbi:MAG: GFA family protein [Gammaproteobacteria bacterium]|nr:GFA family protein [Gammaproteobacteria bacterium]